MTPFHEEGTMAKTVNLDALIQREDMFGGAYKAMPYLKGLRHEELQYGQNTYAVLRKPDFQRSTANWTPEKVRDMVLAYVEGDFVPAIILWRSPQNDLFVIDGAHRLSSIIAWVNDDYGDGDISKKFFANIDGHVDAARKTRDLITSAVGPYTLLSKALTLSNIPQQYIDNAKKLVMAGVHIQDLGTADAAKAERSFFKINEQGVPLSDTEKLMLHTRFCPNSIAARAISQRGTGYPHWGHFGENNKKEVERLAKRVYSLLFEPPLPSGTIKTSNLPIAGEYSSSTGLALLFNAINLSNRSGEVRPTSKEEAESLIGSDKDGTRTIEYLKNTQQLVSTLANRIDTDFMNSLDLHPFVYFYAENGRHQPTLFLAVIEWIREYEEKNKLLAFTKVRAVFEDFLINNRFLISQISRKARGELKAVHRIKEYLVFVVEEFKQGKKSQEIIDAVIRKFEIPAIVDEETDVPGRRMTPPRKSARFITDDIKNAKRCYLCKARVPDHGISFDHIRDKREGGMGTAENAGPCHHFCNGSKDLILGRRARKHPVS
jgi:hypothetical protein